MPHYHASFAAMQVLFSECGYKYVDVRPAYEYDEVGHVKYAINVPVMHMERKWSPEEKKKVCKPRLCLYSCIVRPSPFYPLLASNAGEFIRRLFKQLHLQFVTTHPLMTATGPMNGKPDLGMRDHRSIQASVMQGHQPGNATRLPQERRGGGMTICRALRAETSAAPSGTLSSCRIWLSS